MTDTPRGTHKVYLGDGAYVAYDGYALILTTENGIHTTNIVVLEPEVYNNLTRYVEHLKRQHRQEIDASGEK